MSTNHLQTCNATLHGIILPDQLHILYYVMVYTQVSATVPGLEEWSLSASL